MAIESGNPVPDALRQHAQVVSSKLGDGGVLVHLRTNRIFELNATGYRVWELIGEGLGLTEIQRRLSEEFSVAPDQVRAEVARLVRSLEDEGLLDVGS